MRTIVYIADDILRLAMKRAAEEEVSLDQLVESALRTYLSKRSGSTGYRLQWRSERGTIRPGVNIDDRQSLWGLMEPRS